MTVVSSLNFVDGDLYGTNCRQRRFLLSSRRLVAHENRAGQKGELIKERIERLERYMGEFN